MCSELDSEKQQKKYLTATISNLHCRNPSDVIALATAPRLCLAKYRGEGRDFEN
jgi:hypothetical protein